VEQGIVPLGNSLSRPVPPGLLEDELLDAAGLDDDDDAAAAGAVLEDDGGGGGGAEVEVGALELVVGCWKNSAASEEEEDEDELVLVEDADEVVLSDTSI
jgi:hypothetical protein